MSQTERKTRPEPTVIARPEHGISRSEISDNALKVLYRLRKAGYAAYIVGGGVRDLLLGLHPKDFDVVTDALPDEVRELFRNSRLIGRRFRLAHVRFGREVIEVATFRAADADDESDRSHDSESGRILRDNVYGSIDEDIWRRDFTINSLYYNIADFSVWDYTTGMADIAARTIRLIGEPAQRYREDPVRMLRAVRFAAKLGFTIHDSAREPIAELAPLLRDVPPARLFDEVLKLFQSGHAVRSFDLLEENGLLRYLFPATAKQLEASTEDRQFVRLALEGTDARIAEDQPVTPMFLYAVMLWPTIRELAEELAGEEDTAPTAAMLQACYEITAQQQAYTALPKRYSVPMREVLQLQQRFGNRRGARAARFLQHKRFRAAFDFMLLRSQCGEVDEETAAWWTQVQEQSESEQKQSFSVTRRKTSGRRGSRRRRGRRKSGNAST